jgi:transposase
MRGHHERQAEMLFGETADALIPRDHPLRAIRVIVDAALAQMSERFASMYAPIGRPSVPPEHLLKASLLMALYSIPSERRLCMELRYNLLFKWFCAPRGAMYPSGLRHPPPAAAAVGRS